MLHTKIFRWPSYVFGTADLGFRHAGGEATTNHQAGSGGCLKTVSAIRSGRHYPFSHLPDRSLPKKSDVTHTALRHKWLPLSFSPHSSCHHLTPRKHQFTTTGTHMPLHIHSTLGRTTLQFIFRRQPAPHGGWNVDTKEPGDYHAIPTTAQFK